MKASGLQNPLLRLFLALSGGRGKIGKKFRRKLFRQMSKRSLVDFEARLAQLKQGDICLDLGANMGVVTEKFAATGAEVHAFEPDPHCFMALQKRFAGRANVYLHNQAVSGTAGSFLLRRTLDFAQEPDMQSQSSSIALSDPALYDSSNSVLVETLAFSDFVKSLGRPVAIVKMDIEGAEFSILDAIHADQAAGKASLQIAVMFVETHERHMPDRLKMLKQLRRDNFAGKLPYPIDTFWP